VSRRGLTWLIRLRLNSSDRAISHIEAIALAATGRERRTQLRHRRTCFVTGVLGLCAGACRAGTERTPAGFDFRLLAAPSLTLGCKSGDGPSFWRIELDDRAHVSRVYVPVEAIEQEDDPGLVAVES
jgi:hypothetical protein